nr:DPP IV N-terminal domain-containing protein [Echinimonas agarilytica]
MTPVLPIERIYSDPALVGKSPRQLSVSPDGSRVTYLQGKTEDYEHYDLWEYNIAANQRRLLVDSATLIKGEESLSDEEKARRERQRIYGKGIMEYFWSNDGKSLLFPLNGDIYYYNLERGEASQLTKTDAFETDIRFSPKGNYVSYIRNQNIYIYHLKSGREEALTTDGGGLIKNGMAEFVAQEEMDRMTGYWWAPDESKIAFTQVDESAVEEIIRNEIYAEEIKLVSQRYPSTGTANARIKLAVMDISSQHIDWVDLGNNHDIYLPRVDWFENSIEVSYQWQSRDQKTLKLYAFNTITKAQRLILQEDSNTWINLHHDLTFLEHQPDFVWASERDGFKHLYLYSNKGTLKQQLTHGQWVIDQVEKVDEASKLVYFTGRKDSVLERHLYAVHLETNIISKISKRPGFHSINFAKKGRIYVDDFSSTSVLPQVSVHHQDGQRIAWLEQNDVNESHPYYPFQKHYIGPEFGQLKAKDGQALHYALYNNPNVAADQAKPAIVLVYGGPHAQMVKNSFARDQFFIQHLVSKGYVVFRLDNRGSYGRGVAFESPIYKQLGDVEVEDQIAGAKFLQTLPFVDSSRIGVFGHSYGGYLAQMLMYKAGDYFSAGVSGAPVTDWLLYDTHYTERYLGHPKSNAIGYRNSSVFPYLKSLEKPLMIYHGMADDNVLFTHATKVFKALQDEMKPFEIMTYPGSKHSIRGKNTRIHLDNTVLHFFDRHFAMTPLSN